jgi:hypothetical protein
MSWAGDHETGKDCKGFLKPGRHGPKRNERTDTIREKGTAGQNPLDFGVKLRSFAVEFCGRWQWYPRGADLVSLSSAPKEILGRIEGTLRELRLGILANEW